MVVLTLSRWVLSIIQVSKVSITLKNLRCIVLEMDTAAITFGENPKFVQHPQSNSLHLFALRENVKPLVWGAG